MIHSRTPGDRIRLAFRTLAVAALIAAFAQVTLGGIVRVTESGLGCPDWPLCHGRIIPPFEFATLVEYTHRLSASVLFVLVFATMIVAIVVWIYHYRHSRWVVTSSVIGFGLVVAAAGLGGATVLTELRWWVRLLHLGIAEGVVASMVIASVVAWRMSPQSSDAEPEASESGRFNRMVIAALLGVFILILSGSYMVGYGAGSSCATWPLCRGSLLPEGTPFAIHMGHRFLAALIGLHVLATSMAAWRRRHQVPGLGLVGLSLAILFVAQVLAGAAMVWAGFSQEMKAAHLSLATLTWIALVFMAALVYVPRRFDAASSVAGPRQVSKLEGLTS